MLPSLPGRIRRKPAPLARNLPPRWRVIPVAYSACGFWDTGLNACCLGGELKLLLPEDVWRNEPIVFDQSGGVVAIAERSPCACCALDQKRPDTVGEFTRSVATPPVIGKTDFQSGGRTGLPGRHL